MNSPTPNSSSSMRRISALTTAAVLGVAMALAGLLAVTVYRNARALPVMSPEDFYAAKSLWQRRAPASYNIEVTVTGKQAALYYAEVREGEVTLATRDGEILSRRRTIDTWSVPGMFTTIRSDVTNVERHRDGKADRDTLQVLIRGVYDPTHGAPMRYHRTELRKWGPNVEVMWEVTHFEIVE